MGVGMVCAAGSFVLSALVSDVVASAGDGQVSVLLMIPQYRYALLALGEILTSTTGS